MSLKKIISLLAVLILVLGTMSMVVSASQTGGDAAAAPTEAASAEEPQEQEGGIPWSYTALFLALVVTFLQNKFIHGRKR